MTRRSPGFLEDNQAEVESIFAEALRGAQRGGELAPRN